MFFLHDNGDFCIYLAKKAVLLRLLRGANVCRDSLVYNLFWFVRFDVLKKV